MWDIELFQVEWNMMFIRHLQRDLFYTCMCFQYSFAHSEQGLLHRQAFMSGKRA